jgi:formylglycine-generating enzyme required for sulfatase activity
MQRPSWSRLAAALAIFAIGGCIPDVAPNPLTLPHCATMKSTCGSAGTDDCCASDVIPGATYNRLNDPTLPARVDTFALDRYEVTVGRLRAFVEGYALNMPAPGAGADPSLGPASGWDASWNGSLPADQGALLRELNCNGDFQTWTVAPGANEDAPANCITWHVAFAFCAWDGGWLPTEAEWDFASTGGNQQLAYPWGAAMPDMTRAVYGCDTTQVVCPLPLVGSKPAGAGLFGTLDLAGSVAEWNLDYLQSPLVPSNCGDMCAVLTDMGGDRVLHGGDFAHDQSQLASSFRSSNSPDDIESYIGFRCARAAPL